MPLFICLDFMGLMSVACNNPGVKELQHTCSLTCNLTYTVGFTFGLDYLKGKLYAQLDILEMYTVMVLSEKNY